uniref:Uncharacterized protein n=1 Tax=Ananas comosus var. bracteatus TaxID=296719 RepID=A0A6V7Q676_ANACO|nr:unnamed protein product [Ananas comosus var. bracteatus]
MEARRFKTPLEELFCCEFATWNQGQAEMMFESWFCIGFAIRSQKKSSIEAMGDRDNTHFELNLVTIVSWIWSASTCVKIDESQQRLGGSDLPEMGEFPLCLL